MMKSSAAATFVMSQSQFLPEFFVVSLDDPAMLGYFYQLSEVPRIPPIPSRKQVGAAGLDGAACRGASVPRWSLRSRTPTTYCKPSSRDAYSKIIVVAIGSIG
jgi:hypothetical protein